MSKGRKPQEEKQLFIYIFRNLQKMSRRQVQIIMDAVWTGEPEPPASLPRQRQTAKARAQRMKLISQRDDRDREYKRLYKCAEKQLMENPYWGYEVLKRNAERDAAGEKPNPLTLINPLLKADPGSLFWILQGRMCDIIYAAMLEHSFDPRATMPPVIVTVLMDGKSSGLHN